MKIEWRIHLFAGLAERFGTNQLTLLLDDNPVTVRQLKQSLMEHYAEHQSLLQVAFMACNQAYAGDDDTIRAEDELALLPPVSGGQETDNGTTQCQTSRYMITTDPLSVDAVTSQVIVPEHGATLTFTGTTREWTGDKQTLELEYEAYVPMALRTMEQIGSEITTHWPGALCAIAHRIGVVPIAEISVIIAVSAPHRDQCYEASRYAIERLKQIVPIWKKERWTDGSQWQGHQQGPWNPISPLLPDSPSHNHS